MKDRYYFEQSHLMGDGCVYFWKLSSELYPILIYFNHHKEPEIVQVIQGTLHLYVDDQDTILHKGDIAIINSGQLHHGVKEGDETCIVNVYVLDLKELSTSNNVSNGPIFDALYTNRLWLTPFLRPDTIGYNEIVPILSSMEDLWRKRQSGWEMQMKSLFFGLLYLFFSHSDTLLVKHTSMDVKSNDKQQKMQKLIDYLEKHYPERITVAEMADFLYMGSDNFYKFMVSLTGESPITFVNHFRLLKAVNLLQNTEMSITEISLSCGFPNISYFSRCFRKYYGCTPRQIRINSRDTKHL